MEIAEIIGNAMGMVESYIIHTPDFFGNNFHKNNFFEIVLTEKDGECEYHLANGLTAVTEKYCDDDTQCNESMSMSNYIITDREDENIIVIMTYEYYERLMMEMININDYKQIKN